MAKVSLYLDDAAWRRFRGHVFAKYGTLRKLSEEVEALICSEDMQESMVKGAKKLGLSLDRSLAPDQIRRTRPRLRGMPAESIVRQMRDRRSGGRLPGH